MGRGRSGPGLRSAATAATAFGAQPATGYAVGAVRRLVENLLPEGRALDITATTFHVSKSNVYRPQDA